jgi:hypothetical protein
VHARVSAIQESIEFVTPPEKVAHEPSSERARDVSDLAERNPIKPTRLDRHDHATRDVGQACQVDLPEAAAKTESPNCGTEPLVIHPPSMTAVAYVAINRFAAISRRRVGLSGP